jgi:hypothetical protein
MQSLDMLQRRRWTIRWKMNRVRGRRQETKMQFADQKELGEVVNNMSSKFSQSRFSQSNQLCTHTQVGFTVLPMVRTPIIFPGLPGLANSHHGSSLSINLCPWHPLVTEHIFSYCPLMFSSTFSLVYIWVYYPPPPT